MELGQAIKTSSCQNGARLLVLQNAAAIIPWTLYDEGKL
jgi:hypothetical protein